MTDETNDPGEFLDMIMSLLEAVKKKIETVESLEMLESLRIMAKQLTAVAFEVIYKK